MLHSNWSELLSELYPGLLANLFKMVPVKLQVFGEKPEPPGREDDVRLPVHLRLKHGKDGAASHRWLVIDVLRSSQSCLLVIDNTSRIQGAEHGRTITVIWSGNFVIFIEFPPVVLWGRVVKLQMHMKPTKLMRKERAWSIHQQQKHGRLRLSGLRGFETGFKPSDAILGTFSPRCQEHTRRNWIGVPLARDIPLSLCVVLGWFWGKNRGQLRYVGFSMVLTCFKWF